MRTSPIYHEEEGIMSIKIKKESVKGVIETIKIIKNLYIILFPAIAIFQVYKLFEILFSIPPAYGNIVVFLVGYLFGYIFGFNLVLQKNWFGFRDRRLEKDVHKK